MIRGRTTGTPWRFRPIDFVIFYPLMLAFVAWDGITQRTTRNYR